MRPNPIYLTKREAEVVTLMANGQEYKEIATLLNISTETVKSHVFNLRLRLDAKNIRQAISISIQHGLIQI